MKENFVPLENDENRSSIPTVSRKSKYNFQYVSSHETKEKALAAILLSDGTNFRFLNNYGPNSAASVYQCASPTCSKFIRLVKTSGTKLDLYSSGNHTCNRANRGDKTGISVLIKGQVDAVLSQGAGPVKCRKLLEAAYDSNHPMRRHIPTLQQLKNRKAYLKLKQLTSI